MAKNIIITPVPGGGTYPNVDFQGATSGTIKLEVRDDGSLLFSGATETNILSIYDETANPVRVPSISLEDSNATHHLKIIAGSNLTANRTFTLSTGDAARSLDISAADVTISSFGATIVDDADASAVRTTLGLVIGTNVQAYNANLTTYAGIAPSANVQTLLGAADYSAFRTSLGLVIGTNVQAYDADLTTWAGLTPSAFFQTLVDDTDAATARGTLGLGTSATVNTGTSGATIPLLNGTNTWSGAQSIDVNAATQFTITRTDDGTAGAQMDFIHVSASPANNDTIMTIRSIGRDNGGNSTVYGRIRSFITDPTDGSEDSSWTISGMVAGSETTLLSMAGSTVTYLGNTIWHAGNDGSGSGLDADTVDGKNIGTSGNTIPLLDGTNTWSGTQTFNNGTETPASLQFNDAGATLGPILGLYRNSASAVASDLLGSVRFSGNDASSNFTVYADITAQIIDATDATEDAAILLRTTIGGAAIATALAVGAGVYHPSATGGDKGANTLNIGTIYQNNVALASAAFVATGTSGATIPLLNGANTWSGAQIIATTTGTPLQLITTDAGAAIGPVLNLQRTSASPAASDLIGAVRLFGMDSGGNATVYGDIAGLIVDPTDASEDGAIAFRTTIAGTFASRVRVGAGLYSEGVTGGDKGTNTLNFTTIYQNNVALASAAFVATGTSGATIPLLNGANTWSAAQTFSGGVSGNTTFTGGTNGDHAFTASSGYVTLTVRGATTNPSFILLYNASSGERARIWSDNSRNLGFSTDSGATAHLNISSAGVLTASGNTVWHAGNDGSGSTLDADLLDGLQATAVGAGKQGIWVPAGAMAPRTTTGCAALDTFESGTNRHNIPYLAFDATTAEYAQFNLHANKQFGTTTVTFKAVWMHPSTTTNFGVAWELAGLGRSDDDAAENAFGTAVTVTDTGGTTNDIYITAESSAMTIGGTFAAEDFLTFQVNRAPANGSDTMAVDAQLIGIMIYVTTTVNTDV